MKQRLLASAAGATAIAATMVASAAIAQTQPQQDASANATSVSEVVVTGYRSSLESAERVKEKSAEVVEAITPEDLGKFTDNSIAGALQRVPGVQIDPDTDGRSGDHVSIRGVGSEFVTTTVDGRTPGGYGQEGLIKLREFPVDILPTEILSGAVIYKTPSAELVESGLGGEVDFQTLKPLDFKPKSGRDYFGALTLKDQNNSMESKWGPGVSGVIGGKFLNETVGVYLAGLKSTNILREDFDEIRPQIDTVNIANAAGVVGQQQVIFPSYPDFGMMRKTEKRDAVSTGLQWRPNEHFEVSVDYTYSKYDRTDNRDYNTLSYDGGAVLNGVFQPGGVTIKNGGVTALNFADYTPPAGAAAAQVTEQALPLIYNNSSTSQIGGVNVKWRNERWTAALDLSLNRMNALQNMAIFYGSVLGLPLATSNFSANTSGPSTYNAGSPPLTNASLYSISDIFQRYLPSNDEGGAAKFDTSYRVNRNLTVKLGARYSVTDVDVRAISFFEAVTPAQSQTIQKLLYPGGVDTIFPGGNFGMNAQPSQNPAAAYASNPSFMPGLNFGQEPVTGSFFGSAKGQGPWTIDATHSHTNQEITAAGYGQADVTGSVFGIDASGNAGLRVVQTSEEAKAFQTTTFVDQNNLQTGPSVLIPVETRHAYTSFLPSANLTLHPETNMNVRFGVGRTLSRPEFEDMSPIAVVSVPDPSLATTTSNSRGTGTTGNPELRPETAWNFDGTFEYYLHGGGSIVASVFYKLVSDFIAPVTTYNVSIPGQGAQLFNASEAENLSGGQAYGAELGFNQPLKRFVKVLDGFGVQANYTLVESSIDQPIAGHSFSFPGSSKDNVNATLYYSKGPVDMRLAVLYRSNYLSSLPWIGVVNFPTYTEGSTTLDASATYNINRHLAITLTGTNLTEAGRRDYLYQTSTFLNYYSQPRVIALALRGSF